MGVVLVGLVIAFFISLTLKNKVEDKQSANQANQNAQTNNSESPKADFYTSFKYGFTFNFENLKQFENISYKLSVPNGTARLNLDAVTAYEHKIPVEYCSLKGDCIPTTTDMIFGAAVIESNIDDYAKRNPQLEPATNLTYSYSYSEGAEGEGMNYYFIALNPKRTAVIFHKYIDETVNTKYKAETEFIPYTTQKQKIENLLKTFKSTN